MFYVFPLIGTTHELGGRTDLLHRSGIMDVAGLPALSPPTTRRGTLRKNGLHHADIWRTRGTIRSDPIDVEITPLSALAGEELFGFRRSWA